MSPFVSKAQKGWMYVNEPAMARRWQAETPKRKQLPAHHSGKGTSEAKASKAKAKARLNTAAEGFFGSKVSK